MQTLTKKQKRVFNFINDYREENGISPTIEEIRREMKLKAVSTIHEHIDTLKRKGFLLKNMNSTRSIVPKKKIRTIIDIPIVGKIAAGHPIEAIEDFQETIPVLNPAIKNSRDYYALRVVGNSMIGEGIFDGDTVIIRKQNTAENGETVVALLDDNEATLKKIYRVPGGFKLQPANPTIPAFTVKQLVVQGKVISVMRNYESKKNLANQNELHLLY